MVGPSSSMALKNDDSRASLFGKHGVLRHMRWAHAGVLLVLVMLLNLAFMPSQTGAAETFFGNSILVQSLGWAPSCPDWAGHPVSNALRREQQAQQQPALPQHFHSKLSLAGAVRPYSQHGKRDAWLTQALVDKGYTPNAGQTENNAGLGTVKAAQVRRQVCPSGIQMDDAEIAAMSKWMQEGAEAHGKTALTSVYMEWGTGGSTLRNGLRAGHVFAVEHHADWCAMLKRCFGHLGWDHVTTVCAPPDLRHRDWCPTETGRVGLDEGGLLSFLSYVNAPLDAVLQRGLPAPVLDSILVDGRARIACALRAYAFMDMGTALMIHDSNRDYYRQRLAPFFDFDAERDCTKSESGICRLRPKPELVGRMLPEEYIAKVADLTHYTPGLWAAPRLPATEDMPRLADVWKQQ